jgi:hypothetical protein
MDREGEGLEMLVRFSDYYILHESFMQYPIRSEWFVYS